MKFIKIQSAGSVSSGKFLTVKDELIDVDAITNIKKYSSDGIVYYYVYTPGVNSICPEEEAQKIFDALGISFD